MARLAAADAAVSAVTGPLTPDRPAADDKVSAAIRERAREIAASFPPPDEAMLDDVERLLNGARVPAAPGQDAADGAHDAA